MLTDTILKTVSFKSFQARLFIKKKEAFLKGLRLQILIYHLSTHTVQYEMTI